MRRFRFVTHREKEIALIDLSNAMPEEAMAVFDDAARQIASRSRKSVLALTDSTKAFFDRESARALTEFAIKNTPYIKASAVIGADSLRIVLLNTVTAEAGREIQSFATREEAMDWLVSQG
jgi:hypothetical protein